jgi:hypothetical protein
VNLVMDRIRPKRMPAAGLCPFWGGRGRKATSCDGRRMTPPDLVPQVGFEEVLQGQGAPLYQHRSDSLGLEVGEDLLHGNGGEIGDSGYMIGQPLGASQNDGFRMLVYPSRRGGQSFRVHHNRNGTGPVVFAGVETGVVHIDRSRADQYRFFFRMPEATMRSEQGGVRPWWLQGSNVT